MHTLTEDFLKVQKTYFRILGFDIVEGTNGWLHPCKTLWGLISLAAVQPMIFAFSVKNLKNVDMLTDGVGSMLVNLLALLKFGLIIWLHKDFQLLVGKFRKMLLRGKHDELYSNYIILYNNNYYYTCLDIYGYSLFIILFFFVECDSEVSAFIISQENRREQRVSGFYKNSFMLTGALSCVMPIVSTVLFYWRTGQIQLQLTFPCM